jgi:hypothetical protein
VVGGCAEKPAWAVGLPEKGVSDDTYALFSVVVVSFLLNQLESIERFRGWRLCSQRLKYNTHIPNYITHTKNCGRRRMPGSVVDEVSMVEVDEAVGFWRALPAASIPSKASHRASSP